MFLERQQLPITSDHARVLRSRCADEDQSQYHLGVVCFSCYFSSARCFATLGIVSGMLTSFRSFVCHLEMLISVVLLVTFATMVRPLPLDCKTRIEGLRHRSMESAITSQTSCSRHHSCYWLARRESRQAILGGGVGGRGKEPKTQTVSSV